jgi:hypothetical protein
MSEGTRRALYNFHPTLILEDRLEAEAFFQNVFGMESVHQGTVMYDPRLKYNDDYPMDYSVWTWIGDLWFDTIQPDLYRIVGADPVDKPNYRHMIEMAFLVDDVDATLAAFERNRIKIWNQYGDLVTLANKETAISAATTEIALFWPDPADTGMAMEICHFNTEFGRKFGEICYPPFVNGWKGPKPRGPNPLGIEFCAFHSVLTDNVPRALRWSTSVLGGNVISTSIDHALQTENTYVWIGESVVQFARPLQAQGIAYERHKDKSASLSGKMSDDVYWSLGLKVSDLEKTRDHLKAVDLPFENLDDHRVIVAPEHGLGVRWCFTDQNVEGDTRTFEQLK